MGRIVITGGSGYLGTALARAFTAADHEVIVLSRQAERIAHLPNGARAAVWDGRTANGWSALADGADAIFNMAGATIARPHWTPAYRRSLIESRVNAGRAVGEAIGMARRKPAVLLQMSGIGYYGDTGIKSVDENSPPGTDYFAQVCIAWERATEPVEAMGVRRAILRTSPVYGKGGGIYRLVALPFRFFVGGALGSGKQYAPWIHLTDWLNAVRMLIEDSKARGAYNLTAPDPLTQGESARVFGKALGRPAFMPVPAFALRLALGETADLILLTGQRAQPKRLLEAGFHFQYPTLESALREIESK